MTPLDLVMHEAEIVKVGVVRAPKLMQQRGML
jgi:hypothetical protein